jgi:hypothetical protein
MYEGILFSNGVDTLSRNYSKGTEVNKENEGIPGEQRSQVPGSKVHH